MAIKEGNARVAAVAGGRRIEERDGGQTPVGEIEERERGGVGRGSSVRRVTQIEKKIVFFFFNNRIGVF